MARTLPDTSMHQQLHKMHLLDDETSRRNVIKTIDVMFWILLQADKNSSMVMGEFAGLFGKDAHPLKTTKRTTDFTIEVMHKDGYASAYMWSLNSECVSIQSS
ncbi:hypothetical protein PsorP6_006258 [Peronosclerospora sorghi]|uniref:Uncharacterized protein n=1 Tax=Peronosclerospora sorghi TaxID=230839 RepID=A0ACC0W3W2_9STRA|nr:hypothetical protein PsorP6_006258 [Peronosclerospora sorghi]